MLLFAFFCYLGLFAWNARTGYLDTIAERSGLEVVGHVLSPLVAVQDSIVGVWEKYMALVDVAEENERLRAELKKAQQLIVIATEEKAELHRLRELFDIAALRESSGFAARVIAMRFGPQSVLKTLSIDKGYADGAVVGTPVVAPAGVVGRVYRMAPRAATVLLITDPGFRLAVISQTSRTPGIIKGVPGESGKLEMTYVAQNASITAGELLITAGVDGVFPKGLAVGIVTLVEPAHETLFQKVTAEPIVNLGQLEEVVLLEPMGTRAPLITPPPIPVGGGGNATIPGSGSVTPSLSGQAVAPPLTSRVETPSVTSSAVTSSPAAAPSALLPVNTISASPRASTMAPSVETTESRQNQSPVVRRQVRQNTSAAPRAPR